MLEAGVYQRQTLLEADVYKRYLDGGDAAVYGGVIPMGVLIRCPGPDGIRPLWGRVWGLGYRVQGTGYRV